MDPGPGVSAAATDNDRQRIQGIDSTVGGRYPRRRLVGVLDSPVFDSTPFPERHGVGETRRRPQ